MNTNERMAQRIERVRASGRLGTTQLAPELAELVRSPLIRLEQGIVQKPLLPHTVPSDAYPDRTGFEAALSKIHVEDFVKDAGGDPDEMLVQGLLYAERMVGRLGELDEPFRVLVCVDDATDDVTCRFHAVSMPFPCRFHAVSMPCVAVNGGDSMIPTLLSKSQSRSGKSGRLHSETGNALGSTKTP